jgi:MarR family transcriptional regulator, organic hydroperoxide resistance regulator
MARKSPSLLTRNNTGFLLAKAMQRWNEHLSAGFRENGYPQVRPSYGSILIPLFEEDGLRMGELARRSKLTKQTMTTMVRLLERDGLVKRKTDGEDGRATRVFLSRTASRFRPVADGVLARLETAAAGVGSPKELAIVRAWLRKFAAG